MTERLSDEALVVAMAVSDHDACRVFVRRFQHRVYGLAVLMLGDPALAQDVAQEAFVRMWRHASSFDARRGAVSTWALGITRNLAIDAIRARRVEPVPPEELAQFMQVSTIGDPALETERNADQSRLRMLLADLPEAQRRAVVLAVIGGRSSSEVARIENIPQGTAKTRLRAGLLRLRAELSGVVNSDG